ncbi:HD-like signal output (HDOD) domain, no enzymatic activity [Desulfuromusa kysingii]|uniref:HD-like signal output (HDOD) domain, no enzymatic activity n=1 Tax=Desulfuromusa kysingii TaxID=37625 RepID=A0A1H4AGK7_9BACT|nr:HDOD domain-containing protein [Desulfuromusa kysingii]SEA34702.1 HD-like signal output (HDOD) domain, no enzymatic activity [Desulfuromusa kysingii]
MKESFQSINFDLDNLPAMPTVAAQMMELVNDPNVSARAITKVITKDPSVAARVLKIANSSFYSMTRQVTSLPTAIVLLGETTLRNLVLATSLKGINLTFGSLEKMLWQDSIVCALASRYLSCKLAIADPEEAFIAGLFRNIGLIVLNNQKGIPAEFIFRTLQSSRNNMAKQEREIFGATHAEIGAAVLESWKLSDTLCLVTLHHSDVQFEQEPNANVINLTSIVNIADQLPGYFGVFGRPIELNLQNLSGPQRLNLDLEQLSELIEGFRVIFEENRKDFLA